MVVGHLGPVEDVLDGGHGQVGHGAAAGDRLPAKQTSAGKIDHFRELACHGHTNVHCILTTFP